MKGCALASAGMKLPYTVPVLQAADVLRKIATVQKTACPFPAGGAKACPRTALAIT